jgi:hypothetical protein
VGKSQIDYFDERTPGLALRVTEQGHKAWCFIFTAPSNGKRARETFATYPATGLALARTRAREARALVEANEDPRAVFNAQAAGAMTATALIDSFLEKHARPNLRTAAEIERRLRKNVIPLIGNVRLAELHRRDINRAVDPIVRRDRLAEACRVFEDLRSIMRWALSRGDLDRNPMEGMKKARRAANPHKSIERPRNQGSLERAAKDACEIEVLPAHHSVVSRNGPARRRGVWHEVRRTRPDKARVALARQSHKKRPCALRSALGSRYPHHYRSAG